MARKNFTPNPEAIADKMLEQAGETVAAEQRAATGKATITATLNAYLNPDFTWAQDDYLRAMATGDHAMAVNALSLTTAEIKAYAFMGRAEITVHLHDERAVKDSMISALKEQRDELMATAHAKAVQIDAKIQNLLAIEFTPA